MSEKQEQSTGSNEVSNLLKKNFELLENIQKQNQKILRNFFWMHVASILKILFILVPIVLGLIFLPPFFRQISAQYGEVIPYFNNQNFEDIIKVLESYRLAPK